jgi:dihydropyrimidinase
MVFDPEHIAGGDLRAFRQGGAAAFKLFLSYRELGIECSTKRLVELMRLATETDLTVQVHCENGAMIEALVEDAVSRRQTGVRPFVETRPAETEEEAVAQSLAAASLTRATCYLVHLSSRRAVEQVRLARRREPRDSHGSPRSPRPARFLAEVCLHHLVFDDGVYDGPAADRYLVAPPLRSPDDVEALWEALSDGTIDTVGSDHSQRPTPLPRELSEPDRRLYYGLAGVGARLPVLLSEGLARSLPLERLVEVSAAAPARIFGLYPRKGALAPGSDADLVIWDPAGETLVTERSFDDGTGDSIYRGRLLRGRVRDVLVHGLRLVADGELVREEPIGRFVSSSAGRLG